MGGGLRRLPFPERILLMFARIVDLVSSRGKTRILNETIQNKVLPTLRVQPGFVDEIVLESDVEPDRFLTLTFWKTREQAELYNRVVDLATLKVLTTGSVSSEASSTSLTAGYVFCASP